MANVLDLKPTAPEPEPSSELFTVPDIEPVEWKAHHPLPSRARRYALMGTLALVGAGVAWWQTSALTFVVVLLGLATWEISERYARPITVHLDEGGLTVDGERYPATRLSSFDIHQMPDGTSELSIATTAWHSRRLRLHLGEQDPEHVRAILSGIVPEEEHPIPLLDWWLRK